MSRRDGYSTLAAAEDHYATALGGLVVGEGRVVYRGRHLHGELARTSWMGLYMLGITGREFSEAQLKLFQGLWALAVSYPDPRIWNNRVAALAGTARTTGALASMAASAMSEAEVYGFRAILRAYDFLIRTQRHLGKDAKLQDLVQQELLRYRAIPGYGRPVRSTDERIGPCIALARELDLADGPLTRLAFEVEAILIERWRQRMNVAALAAALCGDQGLSLTEYYAYTLPDFLAGIVPCYLDAANHPEGTFFPLRCERIAYEGVAPRPWHEPC